LLARCVASLREAPASASHAGADADADAARAGVTVAACLSGACGALRPPPAAVLRVLVASLAAQLGLAGGTHPGGWRPPASVGRLRVALRGLCAAHTARGPAGARRVCLLLDDVADVDDPRLTDWLPVRLKR
jgi:hypothetical protein